MADPVVLPIPKDTWTLINPGGGVTSGQVDVLKSGPIAYIRAIVDTGNAAPTNETSALRFFNNFEIASSSLIDIYVKAKGAAGEILVTL